MTQIFKNETVLVLDLDDTIYKEISYKYSGMVHVSSVILKLTGIDIKNDLISRFEENEACDFLQIACELSGLPQSAKESLLWVYRLHFPDIELEIDVERWIERCKLEYLAVAILTDGRSITQRLKLTALGIHDLPCYISEEWGASKPDQKRFVAIQERWDAKNYVYVGDNLRKDFLAPNDLGWLTIGVQGDSRNIHQLAGEQFETSFHPMFWVCSLLDIEKLILDDFGK